MKVLTYNSKWWPHQLHNAAMMGDRILAANGNAMLERDGGNHDGRNFTDSTSGFFVMVGPTGRHSLAVSATDATRLATHWKGFIERAEATILMVPSKRGK